MRTLLRSFALVALSATPALAEPANTNLLDPNYGLMAWTLFVFVGLFLILKFFAFGPILKSVEAREQALEDAINAAKRDREEAGKLLAEHRAALDASRGEAQKLIADARIAAERVRPKPSPLMLSGTPLLRQMEKCCCLMRQVIYGKNHCLMVNPKD